MSLESLESRIHPFGVLVPGFFLLAEKLDKERGLDYSYFRAAKLEIGRAIAYAGFFLAAYEFIKYF